MVVPFAEQNSQWRRRTNGWSDLARVEALANERTAACYVAWLF